MANARRYAAYSHIQHTKQRAYSAAVYTQSTVDGEAVGSGVGSEEVDWCCCNWKRKTNVKKSITIDRESQHIAKHHSVVKLTSRLVFCSQETRFTMLWSPGLGGGEIIKHV